LVLFRDLSYPGILRLSRPERHIKPQKNEAIRDPQILNKMVIYGLIEKRMFLYLLIVSGTPSAGNGQNLVIGVIIDLLLLKDHSQTI
jgi:hypothetical protein